MDREFCIDYILDDCLDCPEKKDGECQTESHCFEVKKKIISDLRKLERIKQIINNYDGSMYSMKQQFNEIQKVLEKE